MDIVHMRYLHDRVRAHRAHGKEMEDRKEDQHCLLKWSLLKWKKRVENTIKNTNKELIHLSAWILAGLDQEVDNVEDVEGSPREEEHDTHANQDPVRNHVQALGYVAFDVLHKNENIVNNVSFMKMWDQTC